ncbi:sensor histidine kinase [Marinicrinis lubricantis]|uniref:Sensor histidine kinase n=1 Tax=Marinicrinis lubricantis TaxID=2086470 RepID=A0ABW1IRG8_9BACL
MRWNRKNLQSGMMKYVLLRDRSLMTKLLAYFVLLVVLPLLLVGLLSYREASGVLERESRQYSWQILEQVKIYMEDYLRDFEISTLKILNHADMVNYLKVKTVEEAMDSDLNRAARNVLKNAAYSRSDIANITVILDGIQTISSTVDLDPEAIQSLSKQYWYDQIPVQGELMMVSRVIPYKDREEPVISIMKRIVSPHTLEPFGLLIIDLNYKRIQEVVQKVTFDRTGYLYIMDAYGRYVYHPDLSLVGKKVERRLSLTAVPGSTGYQIAREGEKTYLTFTDSSTLKWRLVASIPYKELMSGTKFIGRTILLITGLFMLIAYVLGIGLAASLVRPIRRLYRHMKQVELGRLSERVEVQSMDEIGLLSHGYNQMLDRLSRLLEEIYISKLKETESTLRYKESELKVLQSQINPHFLYNALETLRGMALEKDMEEMAAMTASLARLLRYNVKEGSPVVTIEQEKMIAEQYLRIQQFRYEHKLTYRLALPDWVLQQQTVRFTLQPLLENCITHALEPSAEKIEIDVGAEKIEDDAFELVVHDTGTGIGAVRLQQINQMLHEEQEPSHIGHHHIGLMNVHWRIRHIFGECFGVKVESESGEGTRVRVRLPLRKIADCDEREERDASVSVIAGGG